MHTHPLRRASVVLIGLLALIGTGCSALNVKQPTATLNAVSVPAVSQEGVTVNFDLGVVNPNAFAIPLSKASYKLGLSGVQVIDDEAHPSASIPANGSLPVTLPVRLTFQQLLKAEQGIAQSGGNVPYTFDGALEFQNSKIPMLGAVRVPLKYSGTLPLRDALQAVMRDPGVLNNPDARKLLASLFGGNGILGKILGR